jgi:hypothetical protein
VTTPATVPVDVDCAHAGSLPAQTTNTRTRASFIFRVCIAFLLTERLNVKRLTGKQPRETSRTTWSSGEKIADCRHPTPPPVHKFEQLQQLSTIETAKGKTEEFKNGQQDEPNETATIVPNNML